MLHCFSERVGNILGNGKNSGIYNVSEGFFLKVIKSGDCVVMDTVLLIKASRAMQSSFNSAANKDMMAKIWTNGDTIICLSRKHFGKRRNCSLQLISPFPTIFSKAVYC